MLCGVICVSQESGLTLFPFHSPYSFTTTIDNVSKNGVLLKRAFSQKDTNFENYWKKKGKVFRESVFAGTS